jgi:hypothetical protein
MRPLLLRLLVVALAAACCTAGAARAEGSGSAVRDGAGLFSREKIDRADKKIEKIRREYNENLFVETVPAVSGVWSELPRFLSPWRENQHLAAQAREWARQKGPEGIYVLICKEPRAAHVAVRPSSKGQKFTTRDREQLRRDLLQRLQQKGPDQALLETVDAVGRLLEAKAAQPKGPSASGSVLGGLVLGLLALWAVLGLVRLRLRSADPEAEGVTGPTDPLPALLGSMFGTTAALWVYDTLFHRGLCAPSSLAAAESAPAAAGEPPAPEGAPAQELVVGDNHENAPV